MQNRVARLLAETDEMLNNIDWQLWYARQSKLEAEKVLLPVHLTAVELAVTRDVDPDIKATPKQWKRALKRCRTINRDAYRNGWIGNHYYTNDEDSILWVYEWELSIGKYN